jgi:hypothetical protein
MHNDGANPGLPVVKPTREMHIYVHAHNLAVYFWAVQNWRTWPCSIKEFSTYHIAPANFTTSRLKENWNLLVPDY